MHVRARPDERRTAYRRWVPSSTPRRTRPRARWAAGAQPPPAALRRQRSSARSTGASTPSQPQRSSPSTGVDPWHDARRRAAHPPDAALPRHAGALRPRGDAGRRMMRLTASLQVCVDLLPGRAGREQWLVANLAGPSLVAAFAGARERTRIWQGIDPARTGYDGRHLDLRRPDRRVSRVRPCRRTASDPGGRGRRLPPQHPLPAGPPARRLPRAALPRLPATDRRAARHHLGADV